MSFLACAVGWSWEINYRFRVPHVDVETGSMAKPCSQMRRAEASKPIPQM